MEQKFDLINCTDYQKPVFAAQQLRGAAGAWWANLLAAQPTLDGIMLMKLEEFLALKQGDQFVM
jgi:hypothetical protein